MIIKRKNKNGSHKLIQWFSTLCTMTHSRGYITILQGLGPEKMGSIFVTFPWHSSFPFPLIMSLQQKATSTQKLGGIVIICTE